MALYMSREPFTDYTINPTCGARQVQRYAAHSNCPPALNAKCADLALDWYEYIYADELRSLRSMKKAFAISYADLSAR
jgi:hypothetical protein